MASVRGAVAEQGSRDSPSWAVTRLWRGGGICGSFCSFLCSCFSHPWSFQVTFLIMSRRFARLPACPSLPEAGAEGAARGHLPRHPPGARGGRVRDCGVGDTGHLSGGVGRRPPAPSAEVTRQMGTVGHWSGANGPEMKDSPAS